jgi:hypothetical protein
MKSNRKFGGKAGCKTVAVTTPSPGIPGEGWGGWGEGDFERKATLVSAMNPLRSIQRLCTLQITPTPTLPRSTRGGGRSGHRRIKLFGKFAYAPAGGVREIFGASILAAAFRAEIPGGWRYGLYRRRLEILLPIRAIRVSRTP